MGAGLVFWACGVSGVVGADLLTEVERRGVLAWWAGQAVAPPATGIPAWVGQGSLAVGVLLGVFVVWVLSLRRSVGRKTEALQNSNRALKVLSECNQALARAVSEPALLDEVCDLTVRHGGYCLAWVGWAIEGEGGRVKCVAVASRSVGKEEASVLAEDMAAEESCPSTQAVKTGRSCLREGLSEQGGVGRWRRGVERLGCRALLGLPLREGSHRLGVLTLGTARVDGFSTEEVGFLTELASDLAYGLQARRDRADRDRAEAALRESEQRLRGIVDNAPFGAHLYELHGDGRLVFVGANVAADRILGVDHRQFVGKTIEEAFPGLVGTAVPEAYRGVAREGRAFAAEEVAYEGERIRGIYEVHTFQTGPGRMAAFFRDVTERRRAEEELRRSEERFALFMRHLPGLVFLKDGARRILFYNEGAEEHVGLSVRLVLGQTNDEAWPEEVAHKMRLDDERVLTRGEPLATLETVPTRAGLRTFRTIKFPIPGGAGLPMLGGIAIDITELMEAERNLREREERLRMALAEKTVLLREVHHRVKNNLQAVIHLVDLQRRRITDEHVGGFLLELQEQARTMSLVYEQLYQSESLARVEMQEYLLKLTGNLVQSFGRSEEIKLGVEAQGVSMEVGTAMPCGLIVNELVTNSLKHAFPSGRDGTGRIVVKLTASAGGWDLVVSDNGVGMAPMAAEHRGRSMGMKLVGLWVTHQLGGIWGTETAGGVAHRIHIPASGEATRVGGNPDSATGRAGVVGTGAVVTEETPPVTWGTEKG